MRAIDRLLEEYGESHRHPMNKAIHWVAVPVILWTVIALLWSLPVPWRAGAGPLNWAIIALILAEVYWLRLSLALGIGLLAFNLAMVAATLAVQTLSPWPLWQVALGVFAAAWVLQFIGHAIEGKRPSFFKDLQFLLIGPAWLLAFVYRAVGIRY